ncbi:MAG: adenosylhomocysteinase [Geodermatophilaceae bacterium]
MEAIDRIASARRDMPLVAGIPGGHPAPGPLSGRLIAACVHLTPETVVLVEALRGLGARLRLCAANPLSTQDGVAAHLRRMPGVEVVLGTPDWDGYRWAVEEVAAQGADLVIDDGADLILAIAGRLRRIAERRLLGACENTSTGALRLQTAQDGRRSRRPRLRDHPERCQAALRRPARNRSVRPGRAPAYDEPPAGRPGGRRRRVRHLRPRDRQPAPGPRRPGRGHRDLSAGSARGQPGWTRRTADDRGHPGRRSRGHRHRQPRRGDRAASDRWPRTA